MHFEKDEIYHIAISVVTISLAFSLFRIDFISAFLTVGMGFVLHEMAHKYVAQRYGCYAVYRAWTMGLAFALLLAIATQGGFIFAAPGAVYIYGRHLTKEHNGKIALAGPMINFILAIFFLALGSFYTGFRDFAWSGAYVNSFLAVFNMIPWHPFDGEKVKAWNAGAWGVSFALMLALMGAMMFGVIG